MIVNYYMAAPWEERATVAALVCAVSEYALAESKAGRDSAICNATWIDFVHNVPAEDAEMDLSDVSSADVFVQFNPKDYERGGTGGRHVELGYAMGKGKPIIVIDARTTVFHHLSHVRVLVRDCDARMLHEAILDAARVTR